MYVPKEQALEPDRDTLAMAIATAELQPITRNLSQNSFATFLICIHNTDAPRKPRSANNMFPSLPYCQNSHRFAIEVYTDFNCRFGYVWVKEKKKRNWGSTRGWQFGLGSSPNVDELQREGVEGHGLKKKKRLVSSLHCVFERERCR